MNSRLSWSLATFCALLSLAAAQDRLAQMPRYDRYTSIGQQMGGSVNRASVKTVWVDGGKSLAYESGSKFFQINLHTGAEKEVLALPQAEPVRDGTRINQGSRDRGRQFSIAWTKDQSFRAEYRDHNVWVGAKGSDAIQITNAEPNTRIKFGTGSWVYGEELDQAEAMGWSPDGQNLWLYRFDETNVLDYFVTTNHRQVQSALDIEAYPKAGAPNPTVDLYVWNRRSKSLKAISVRSGRLFDEEVGHYVYGIRWSPDGTELLFHRTNRWQNEMEFCAANPETGQVRVLIHESNPNGWVENQLARIYLDEQADIVANPDYKGKVLWMTERTGFQNLGMLDLKSGNFQQLTKFPFEVDRVLQLDLKRNEAWVSARSAPNPYLMQVHRVDLKTGKDVRVTDPQFSHRALIAPDGSGIVTTADDIDHAPVVQLVDRNGKVLKTLAKSDDSKFKSLGGENVERFTFLANDGKTTLYGYLEKPSDFDPNKKYPLLVSVYGGPLPGGYVEHFDLPGAITEFGWLQARIEGRITSGRGRAFKDAAYLKLGQVEIDDQASGVKALIARGFVDERRVGIEGTSYGGYASAMCLLRYPDVFTAACACSSVTDWRNYDTIYTERYMRTPQVNPEGYKLGAAKTYASNLKGRLMLFFGTADNNVHMSNSLQLISELQRARKSFEVQVGPDAGHSGINQARMLEFFFDAWRN